MHTFKTEKLMLLSQGTMYVYSVNLKTWLKKRH